MCVQRRTRVLYFGLINVLGGEQGQEQKKNSVGQEVHVRAFPSQFISRYCVTSSIHRIDMDNKTCRRYERRPHYD